VFLFCILRLVPDLFHITCRNYLQALKRQTEDPTRCDIRVQNGCPDWFCLEIGKDACSVSGVCGRQHLRVRHRSLHLLVLTVGSTRNVHPIGSKVHSTLASWFAATVAVLTSCLAYVFDWNETHVYNPHWPPHAKFHNAQTLLLGPLLGTVSLFFLWGKHDLGSAVLTCSLYWIAQLGSLAFPGTALIDPEFRDRQGSRIPRQPLLASFLLALLVTAWMIA
jgi:hypothetical protein